MFRGATMFDRIFRGSGGMGRGGGGQDRGRGKGGGNRPGAGPVGNCICPNCGYKMEHVVSERCMDRKCPKCGTGLVRE